MEYLSFIIYTRNLINFTCSMCIYKILLETIKTVSFICFYTFYFCILYTIFIFNIKDKQNRIQKFFRL